MRVSSYLFRIVLVLLIGVATWLVNEPDETGMLRYLCSFINTIMVEHGKIKGESTPQRVSTWLDTELYPMAIAYKVSA
ncbi:hypothetical protein KDAU_62320 [Dictyobacter aurantiacus]|uniref:Uncharacterized protein n=1 Tax=Dictyobacter aurantiacus TaxID=1936993 RepID=A0A401ZPV5_9CHLR|nr:hypothetical protein KDAU_62320 [Dictyobacter aurantiacus]